MNYPFCLVLLSCTEDSRLQGETVWSGAPFASRCSFDILQTVNHNAFHSSMNTLLYTLFVIQNTLLAVLEVRLFGPALWRTGARTRSRSHLHEAHQTFGRQWQQHQSLEYKHTLVIVLGLNGISLRWDIGLLKQVQGHYKWLTAV